MAGTIGSLAILLVGGSYLASEFLVGDSERQFDSAEWKNWGDERSCDGDSPRLEMVEDLRRNHLRFGMDRKKVVALLGDPAPKRRSIEYGLGGVIDCEFLDLDFNRQNRLVSVVQIQG